MKKVIILTTIILLGITFTIKAQNDHVNGQTKLINPTGRTLLIEKDNDDSWLTFHDPMNYWYSMGIDKSNSGSFSLNTGGALNSSQFVMSSTGNVGIGTTSPTSPLHLAKSGSSIDFLKGDDLNGKYSKAWINIHGKTGGAIQFTNQTTDNKSTIFSNNGKLALVAGTQLEFAVGGSFVHTFVMKEDGNVGIGTTDTFGYKLAVNGTIGAREMVIEVDNEWPDYVFADDYELRTLAETADFIAKNHHLPEMPSAAEVEENGIAVGEMNKLLLKKIEELTLHLIEQNKKIEQLQYQINQF